MDTNWQVSHRNTFVFLYINNYGGEVHRFINISITVYVYITFNIFERYLELQLDHKSANLLFKTHPSFLFCDMYKSLINMI